MSKKVPIWPRVLVTFSIAREFAIRSTPVFEINSKIDVFPGTNLSDPQSLVIWSGGSWESKTQYNCNAPSVAACITFCFAFFNYSCTSAISSVVFILHVILVISWSIKNTFCHEVHAVLSCFEHVFTDPVFVIFKPWSIYEMVGKWSFHNIGAYCIYYNTILPIPEGFT